MSAARLSHVADDHAWKAVHPRLGPAECPNGHYLEPGTYQRSWTPCICPPAREQANGHDTWRCLLCEQDGQVEVYYMPEHQAEAGRGAPAIQLRRGLGELMDVRATTPPTRPRLLTRLQRPAAQRPVRELLHRPGPVRGSS